MHYIIMFFVFLLSSLIYSDEIPSKQKLHTSFYILQENFSLDNRTKNIVYNEKLLPLADSCINNVLEFYPNDVDLLLEVIRTLYIEGNYYLRTEKFILAHKKLILAKKLSEKYLVDLHETDPYQICTTLAKTHLKLPSIYSMVLHHLGQIPIYYKNSPLNFVTAEVYLKQALAIREIIDRNPDQFLNTRDNNTIVGDGVIFKRILSRLYLEMGDYVRAEEMSLSLLNCKDCYNQLLILKQLLIIYQQKGKLAVKEEKKNLYMKAMNCAKSCLELLDANSDMKIHTRISLTYLAIGNLYADTENPFQNLEEARHILQLGKTVCPKELSFTLEHTKEELGHTLYKLSQKELQEAKTLLWTLTENENIDALKNLDDKEFNILNYQRLGDLFFEQKKLIIASAFYSNGLNLALKNSRSDMESTFYKKLFLTESQLLGEKYSHTQSQSYENLIKKYKSQLFYLRKNAKKLIENNTEIELIYSRTLEDYKAILQTIIKDIFTVLGKPPTEDYAVIAFGSIGRGYATPYSDIEFAILLKDESLKPYFERLSEFFCIRINALAESPIAGFNIKSIDWLTRDDGPSEKGLRLDPFTDYSLIPHIPLKGHFELITTPKKLAQIFDSKIIFSHKTKAALYTHTLLFGNESLIGEYHQEINSVLNESNEKRFMLTREIMNKDLQQYYTHLGDWINQKNSYSIKYDFYRPLTVMLDALAIQEGIFTKTPWQLIGKLKEKNIIDNDLKTILLQTVDEIAMIQLSTYLGYNKQNYIVHTANRDSSSGNNQHQNEERLFKIMQAIIYLQNKIIKESKN